jgi:sulfate/thiosulfate transport system substrate-binding protein
MMHPIPRPFGRSGARLPVRRGALLLALVAWAVGLAAPAGAQTVLRNMSYDATREFYAEFNVAFAQWWERNQNEPIIIDQSHGASQSQALAIRNGKMADVATLALAPDIELLAGAGLVPSNWRQRLPYNSSPYTSTIVFLVRSNNPAGIRDWPDLLKPGLRVMLPDPRISGGGRWAWLAAWGQVLAQGGDENAARGYLGRLLPQSELITAGARNALERFALQDEGDVLITWESEALAWAAGPQGKGVSVVVPPRSILAEPPVAVVSRFTERSGTRSAAEAYLVFLYTHEGQAMAARHYFRPRLPPLAAQEIWRFQPLELFTVDDLFGGWGNVLSRHFAPGGEFDRLLDRNRPDPVANSDGRG